MKRLGRLVLLEENWICSFFGAQALGQLGELFRMDVNDILWDYTMLPYATALLDERSYAAATQIISTGKLARLSAVFSNASSAVRNRQFCVRCVQQDLSTYGFSYWRRSHHLPGSWTCPTHQSALYVTEIPSTGRKANNRALPHEVIGRPLFDGKASAALDAVVKTSLGWLHRERGTPIGLTATHYRFMAERHGWIDAEKPISKLAIASSTESKFPTGYLERLGLTENGRVMAWPSLLLRPGTSISFAPVKHAILSAVLSCGPDVGENLAYVATHSSRTLTPGEVLDERCARAARARLSSLLESGAMHLTTREFLSGANAWSAYRHRKAELPTLRAIVREFRSSSASVKPLSPTRRLFRLEYGDGARVD